MRFLLEFVYCCGTSNLQSEDSTCSTKQLVPLPSRNVRRKKRGGPDWRPSLGSISEDGATARVQRGVVGAGRDVKRRSSGGGGASSAVTSTARIHHRYYSDDNNCDYGRAAVPIIMPAFSPTPFMF